MKSVGEGSSEMGRVDKVPEDRGVGAEPHQAGEVETTGMSNIGTGQVSGN